MFDKQELREPQFPLLCWNRMCSGYMVWWTESGAMWVGAGQVWDPLTLNVGNVWK